MMKITYNSNNSCGDWWLKDEDWLALEDAGWSVRWKKDDEYSKKYIDAGGRWFGALATEASKEFPSVQAGIAEWERITGQHANAEGCHCCGQPHYFHAALFP